MSFAGLITLKICLYRLFGLNIFNNRINYLIQVLNWSNNKLNMVENPILKLFFGTILEYGLLESYKIIYIYIYIYIIRKVKISRFLLCKQNSAETNI